MDNAIEYILRIIIKHLDIENETGKTIESVELMSIFGDVNKYLVEKTEYAGHPVTLPYKSEIRILRVLRNNVQHGMVPPTVELTNILKYGDRFFQKLLEKIFGLTIMQISYVTIIENDDIKQLLKAAEDNLHASNYLKAIVKTRNACEFGRFYYRDDELLVLGSKIDTEQYRRYQQYISHIPSKYNAERSGIMQRDWSYENAEFCLSFVSHAIMTWQMDKLAPLYTIPQQSQAPNVFTQYINDIEIPEYYPDKTCKYGGFDYNGELFYVGKEHIAMFEELKQNDIYKSRLKITNSAGAIWKDYTDFRIVKSIDIYLIMNQPALWAITLFYDSIPFTETKHRGFSN